MKKHLAVLILSSLWLAACAGPGTGPSPAVGSATTEVPVPTDTNEPLPTDTTTAEPSATPALPTETPLPTLTATLSPWPPTNESSWPQAPWPTAEWSRSSPEAQGIDSGALLAILDTLNSESSAFDSILLIRNGYLVLEAYWSPFEAERRHAQFSSTKSIVSALMGIAYKDGLFEDANQPIIDLFPDLDLDRLDDRVSDIRIEDLLTMSAGMDWFGVRTQELLEGTPLHNPGDYFIYGNQGPQIIINAVQEMTGLDPLDFANQRLFAPLGISEEDVIWKDRAGNLRDGGTGLELRPQDMAKIGYLYLNDGMWDGEQILPVEWVEMSSFPNQFEIESAPVTPPSDGYGYFWWVNTAGGYFTAVGFGGQLITIFPGKDLILVTTGDPIGNTGRPQYDALTNYFVPLEMADAPLPENQAIVDDLVALIAEIGGSE